MPKLLVLQVSLIERLRRDNLQTARQDPTLLKIKASRQGLIKLQCESIK